VTTRRKRRSVEPLVLKRDGELAKVVQGCQHAQSCHLVLGQNFTAADTGKASAEKSTLNEGFGTRCDIGKWYPNGCHSRIIPSF